MSNFEGNVGAPTPLSLSFRNSIQFTDDLTEPSSVHDGPDHLAQDEEGDENLISEGDYQTTAEQQTNGPGPTTYAADLSGEGEPSNDAEPEQAQPVDDEESTVGPLSGDECTELPVVVEENCAQGTPVVADPDDGHPGPAEDPGAETTHEESDDNTPPLGEDPTEYEVVATNEDYGADYNENDQDSEHGETVAIESYARDADWETTTSDVQHTQDDQEQRENDAGGTDKREQVTYIIFADASYALLPRF